MNLSQREGLQDSYLETLLVQCYLKKAAFDLTGAEQQLEFVIELATKDGMVELVNKARDELHNIQNQVMTLQQLYHASPEVFTNVQMKELLSFMQEAQTFVQRKKLGC